MTKKIERNYLEINSLENLKDSSIIPENCLIELVDPSDFQLNKFFYKNVGKKHRWTDRLIWSDNESLCILLSGIYYTPINALISASVKPSSFSFALPLALLSIISCASCSALFLSSISFAATAVAS
mgnify:CR=1 FL=1